MLRALLVALLAFLLPTAQAAGSTSSYLDRIRDSPLALEGVSRTDLTEQYLIATREYDLSYRELKRISSSTRCPVRLPPARRRSASDSEVCRRTSAAFERRYH